MLVIRRKGWIIFISIFQHLAQFLGSCRGLKNVCNKFLVSQQLLILYFYLSKPLLRIISACKIMHIAHDQILIFSDSWSVFIFTFIQNIFFNFIFYNICSIIHKTKWMIACSKNNTYPSKISLRLRFFINLIYNTKLKIWIDQLKATFPQL